MTVVRRVGGAAIVVLAALAGAAAAQQVFRIVGPDGRVTFSDKPPADGRATPAQTVAIPGSGGANTAGLPFELRNVANRYPVVIYTGADCAPCAAGRTFLSSRGIPFSERTVTKNEDIEALKRMAGDGARLPMLTIGSQQLKGFSEPEWAQYLDAAGYPKTSQLPPSWRNPAPAPVVAVQEQAQQPAQAAARPAPRPAQPQATAPDPSEPAPANPAGIRF